MPQTFSGNLVIILTPKAYIHNIHKITKKLESVKMQLKFFSGLAMS